MKRTSDSRSIAAFTLVELLVVIAIIGILVALLLPAVQTAREAARRSQCTNNLKQMALACQNYMSTNNDRLPMGFAGKPETAGANYNKRGLFTEILPFMEQQDVYDRIVFDYGRDPFNPPDPMADKVIPAYVCPSWSEPVVMSGFAPVEPYKNGASRFTRVSPGRSPTPSTPTTPNNSSPRGTATCPPTGRS